jgi:hypothetical protein
MATLNTLWIKRTTLEEMLKVMNLKQADGIEITIAVNDEPNKFEQNVSSWVSQTKEQREAGKPRYYVGNGKTYWSSNGAAAPPAAKAEVVSGDLPF